MPQPPQLAASAETSLHPEAQVTRPGSQVQRPPVHVAPGWQGPWPPQSQAPPAQVPPAQEVPQAPQWLASVAGSMQAPSQSSSPEGQPVAVPLVSPPWPVVPPPPKRPDPPEPEDPQPAVAATSRVVVARTAVKRARREEGWGIEGDRCRAHDRAAQEKRREPRGDQAGAGASRVDG